MHEQLKYLCRYLLLIYKKNTDDDNILSATAQDRRVVSEPFFGRRTEPR